MLSMEQPARSPNHVAFERKLRRLSVQKQEWAATSVAVRLQYLNGIIKQIERLDHEQWARDVVYTRGYNPRHASSGLLIAEQALENAKVLMNTTRRLQRNYKALIKNGKLPFLDSRRANDHTILRSFPEDMYDRFSSEGQAGITNEIYLMPGTNQKKQPKQAHNGRVCLVLGSGLQTYLSFKAMMHQLFVEGDVCFLKHHRLRSTCVHFYNAIFSELIKDGFVATAIGRDELGKELSKHRLVEYVHLTGQRETQEAMIWGERPQTRKKNKEHFRPVFNKRISSSLGSVVPWLIPSGATWTDDEIDHGAAVLASALGNQHAPRCVTPQLVVVDRDWPQRNEFFNAVKRRLSMIPLQPAYYPNTLIRYQNVLRHYGAHEINVIKSLPSDAVPTHKLGNCLPWLLLNVDQQSSTHILENDAGGPVLAFYDVRASNSARMFFDLSIDLLNTSVHGTTTCTMLIPPGLELSNQQTLQNAIQRLRYGSIGINVAGSTMYSMSGVPWGAYPGEVATEPVSGAGFTNNAHFLEGIRNSVTRGPFKNTAQRTLLTSVSFPSHEARLKAIQNVVLRPSIAGLMKVAYHNVKM